MKQLGDNLIWTQLDAVANWARKNSLWPMPFATACCGIELMATSASRHDLSRFGSEVMRFSPRQCDLLIVAGRVVMKMLPVLQRIWLQMPEPKWCISMGACACTGGIFDTYAVVQGIDRFIPVDIYIPGCPPRPEQLIRSLLDLQAKIEQTGTWNAREFAARQQPAGPPRFDDDELQRMRDRERMKLQLPIYNPRHERRPRTPTHFGTDHGQRTCQPPGSALPGSTSAVACVSRAGSRRAGRPRRASRADRAPRRVPIRHVDRRDRGRSPRPARGGRPFRSRVLPARSSQRSGLSITCR